MIKIPNITGLVKVGKNFIMAYRPELLLGAAVTSAVGGAVLAAKGGYEAGQKVLREEYSDLDLVTPEGKTKELDVKEKIQLTWLCYMPAAFTVATSVGTIGGLHLVHVKEKRALATAALAAIEEVKSEAKQFMKDETVGIMTEEEKAKILEERLESDPAVVAEYTDGEIEELYLVRDAKTGRDIWSNKARIEDAAIEVNNVINGSDSVELNHFYRHAGFNLIPEGYEVGWNGALLSLEWDTTVRDDGRPVRVFEFRPRAEKGFDKAH